MFTSTPSYGPAVLLVNRFKTLMAPYFPKCQVMAIPDGDPNEIERWSPEFIFIVHPWVGTPQGFRTNELEYFRELHRFCNNVMFLHVELYPDMLKKALGAVDPGDGGGGFGLGTARQKRYAPRLVYDYRTEDLTKERATNEYLPQNIETLKQMQEYVSEFSPRADN